MKFGAGGGGSKSGVLRSLGVKQTGNVQELRTRLTRSNAATFLFLAPSRLDCVFLPSLSVLEAGLYVATSNALSTTRHSVLPVGFFFDVGVKKDDA